MCPGISIEVLASNELSNLGRREADIAVRNVPPTHPDLVAKKICDVAAHLYGSKDYLRKLGHPLTTEKLNQAEFTGFDRSEQMINTLRGFGLSVSQDNILVTSENHLVQWEMIKQGVAIGTMMESVAAKEPLVERALPDAEAIVFPIWLVAHRQLKTSKRISAVFDVLAESLAALSITDSEQE